VFAHVEALLTSTNRTHTMIDTRLNVNANSALSNIRDNEKSLRDVQDALTTGKENIRITDNVSGFIFASTLKSGLQDLKQASNTAHTSNFMTNLAINNLKTSDDLLLQMISYAEMTKSPNASQETRHLLNVQYQLLIDQLNDNSKQTFSNETLFQYQNSTVSVKVPSSSQVFTVNQTDMASANGSSLNAGTGIFDANSMKVSLNQNKDFFEQGSYNLTYEANENVGIFTLEMPNGVEETLVLNSPTSSTNGGESFTFAQSGVTLKFSPGVNLQQSQGTENGIFSVNNQSKFAPQFTSPQMSVSVTGEGNQTKNGNYSIEYIFNPADQGQKASGEFIISRDDGLQDRIKIGEDNAVDNSNAKIQSTMFGLDINFFGANLSSSIAKNDNVINASNISINSSNLAEAAFSPEKVSISMKDNAAVMSGSYALSYNVDNKTGIGTFSLFKPNGLVETANIAADQAKISSTVNVEFAGGIKMSLDTVDLSNNIDKQHDLFTIGKQNFSRDFQIGATDNEKINVSFNVMNSFSLGLMNTNIETVENAESLSSVLKEARGIVQDEFIKFGTQSQRIEQSIEDLRASTTEQSSLYSKLSDTDIQKRYIDFSSIKMVIDISGDVLKSTISALDKLGQMASSVIK
jgi:flagellin-like hook-associated protein FlgL